MQVAVENLSSLERLLKVSIPAEEVEKEYESRLKKAAQTVKLKGFRPGKVPLNVVKMQFGDDIHQEVVGDLIKTSFYDALSKEHLHIAGTPHIQPKNIEKGAALEYEAKFEIYPEIKFHDLAGVKIEKLSADITDQDLDKIIQKLRSQYTEWAEVSRPSQIGDQVVIDFDGFVDGEKFDGGAAKDFALVLGSKNMIPGFEDGLVNAKPGDKVELNVEFPLEYPRKDLAGKPAKFDVVVNKVMEPKLPELNDEFAKSLDVTGGIDGLKAEVRKSMARELERGIKEHLKRQVIEQIIKLNATDVPKTLIDAEIVQMQEQVKQRIGMDRQGHQHMPDLPREHFEEQAKQRVTIGLLLSEFINDQKLKADKAKIREIVNEIASAYDNPEQISALYMQNNALMSQVEALVLEEQAIEKLLENAEVTTKNVNYDEIVNR